MQRVLLILCFAAASLVAQSSPCVAQNHTNTNLVGTSTPATAVPAVHAFRLTLPAGLTMQSIEIFTGNTQTAPGFMMLELWTHDPTTNLPGLRHTGGTWQISNATGAAWQGANFDLHINLVMPTPYWIVWSEPGRSLEPYEPGGATMPAAELVGGSWTMLPTPRALKWRVHCGWLERANVTVTGSPCLTFPRPWGTMFTNQSPVVGNAAFALEGTGFPPGLVALLALGYSQSGGPPVPGLPPNCLVLTSADAVQFGATGTGDVLANAATTGASGHVWFGVPVPPDAMLIGLSVHGQLAVLDPLFPAPLPFILSNGLHLVVY